MMNKNSNIKRYKIIVLLIYILSIILYVLYSSGILLFTEECTFFEYTEGTLLRKFQIFFFVAYSFFVSILLLSKGFRFVIYFIIPLLAHTTVWFIMDRKFERKLSNEKSIVAKAFVINNYSSSRKGGLNVRFNKGEYKWEIGINTHVKTDEIGYGDTVLIKYLESCNYVVGLYEAYPTKTQLDKCKNDCYLINGKLIPIKKE